MRAPLSQNEVELLDRQVATLSYQLTAIVNLLESRLGDTNELAISSKDAQKEFDRFSMRIRRHTALLRAAYQSAGSHTQSA